MSKLMQVILKKEWIDAIRDRRTLMTMLSIVIDAFGVVWQFVGLDQKIHPGR